MTNRDILVRILAALKENNYPENYTTPLLAHLEIPPLDLDSNATLKKIAQLEDVLTKLRNQMPIEYITGTAAFFGHTFKVTQEVLIPRVDTELLVEKSLALIKEIQGPLTIIDIGTGSGALIISLAKALERRKELFFWATDISAGALEIAKENAVSILGKNHILSFYTCDVVPQSIPETSNVFIITNPPYIASSVIESLPASVRDYEPRLALEEQPAFLPTLQIYIDALINQSKSVHIAIEYNDANNSMIQRFASPFTVSLRALLQQ